MAEADPAAAAWLVDLDGTLYAPLPVKLAMGVELLLCGRRALPVIRAFRRRHEDLRERSLEADESAFELQLELAAGDLGLAPELVRPIILEWMVERPGPWLRRFRRRRLIAELRAFIAGGGRAALVSDYPALRKLEALGLKDLFEVVVASGDPGGPARLKPAPDGFLAAAHALGVPPEQCLVIGDRPDADGAAAAAAGMRFRRVP